MGRDQHPGLLPERVIGGQRLRVGHVQRRPDPAGGQLGDERVGIDQLAAGHVDQQRAVRQEREFPRADQALGLRGVRGDEEDDVGLGQQLVQFVDRVHAGAGAACHPGDRGDLEAVQPALDGLPDVPVPDDQRPLVGQRPAQGELPGPVGLVPGEHVQLAAAGQGQGDGQLGGAGVVQARRVAQRHPGRHQRQELLVAGRQGLHHLQLGHVCGPLEDGRAPHVGQHVKGDLVDRAGEVVAVGPVEVEFQPGRKISQASFGFGAVGVGHPGEWHGSASSSVRAFTGTSIHHGAREARTGPGPLALRSRTSAAEKPMLAFHAAELGFCRMTRIHFKIKFSAI